MFFRNSWYIAAWASELGRELRHCRVLNEAIVLYRKEDGTSVALEDACPHRKLPLSLGVLKGDVVQCGYHGLEFDSTGTCVHIPGQDRIPPQAAVQCYPTTERWGLIWIWMGDIAEADEAKIIDIPHYDDLDWGINRGPVMEIDCDYRFMTDNLVDPSHVAYVHKTSLGNDACLGVPVKTEVEDNKVIVTRWIRDCVVAPFFEPHMKFDGNADRLQHYEVRLPSSAVIKDVISPAGTGAPEGNVHPDSFLLDSYNFLTPVTENRCSYYWFQVRNFDPESETTSSELTEAFTEAFAEDLVVLKAVHDGMGSKVTGNITLSIDAASVHLRRMLDQMIQEEQGA